jgi:hypothetical protein
MEIFAAALEYAPGQRLDGTACTFVRFRVIVDGEAGLWTEDDCVAALQENDIAVHSAKVVDGTYIARINAAATDLSGFVEWQPDNASDTLTLRTFLTVLGPQGTSLFSDDDCWHTIRVGGRPLSYWYERLK